VVFIDSHAHLTSPDVISQLDAILKRAKMAHIAHVVNICTDPETLREGLLLSEKHPWIKNAGATTPHDVAREGKEVFPIFEEAARTGKLCAVGETGLDYHYEHSPHDIQKQFLEKYLNLAAETKLPVIFHCREAFADLFTIADGIYTGPAILHCFTGTLEEAEGVLQRGWYLSFSGITTFKKSGQLREVAKIAPLSQMLIETDTPYLAPQTQRGKPNEPSFLPETAQCIANAKGISVSEVAGATSENAKKLFRF
jgi:TatD DNase family protein